jgi:hypothetical protein
MRGNARENVWLVPCLAFLAMQSVSCLSTVNVVYDKKVDFSQYSTWAWGSQESAHIEAPHREDLPAIDAELAEHIERELAIRGLRRVSEGADLKLGYRLVLARRYESVDVASAPDLLSSHNSSASYLVVGSVREPRVFDEFVLTLAVSESTGRMVWRASMFLPVEVDAQLPLGKVASRLVRRFPK